MTTLYDNFFFNPTDTKVVDVNYTVPEGKFARIRPWQKNISITAAGNANASFPVSSFSINGNISGYFPSALRKVGTNSTIYTYTVPAGGKVRLEGQYSGVNTYLRFSQVDGNTFQANASPSANPVNEQSLFPKIEFYCQTNFSMTQLGGATSHTAFFLWQPLYIARSDFFAKSGTVITVSNLSLMIEEFDNPLGV